MSISPGQITKLFASIVSLDADSSIVFETLAILVPEMAISIFELILFAGSISVPFLIRTSYIFII